MSEVRRCFKLWRVYGERTRPVSSCTGLIVWITQRITGAREGGFRFLAFRREPRFSDKSAIVYEVGGAVVFLEPPAVTVAIL